MTYAVAYAPAVTYAVAYAPAVTYAVAYAPAVTGSAFYANIIFAAVYTVYSLHSLLTHPELGCCNASMTHGKNKVRLYLVAGNGAVR